MGETRPDTNLTQHRMPAEAIMEVITTMTGEATLWKANHGVYFNLDPVTNMEGVSITFYSIHRDGYKSMEREDFDNIEATLRRSRRWGFHTPAPRD